MKEDRRKNKKGLPNSRLLTAAVITALFLGSGNALAEQHHSANPSEITEQTQTQVVVVTVVDSQGEPVIGANVVEKGTTNGSITDLDGKVQLTVKNNAILQVSFVGYKTQEVKAAPTLRVVLKEPYRCSSQR